MRIPIILAFSMLIIPNLAYSQEYIPDWVSDDVVSAAHEVYMNQLSSFPAHITERRFGQDTTMLKLADLRYPTKLGKYDYDSYDDRKENIDFVFTTDAYKFQIYCGDDYYGYIQIMRHHDTWIMQSAGGFGGNKTNRQDRHLTIYTDYIDRTDVEFIEELSGNIFVVSSEGIQAIYKWDYVEERMRAYDPYEHILEKKNEEPFDPMPGVTKENVKSEGGSLVWIPWKDTQKEM